MMGSLTQAYLVVKLVSPKNNTVCFEIKIKPRALEIVKNFRSILIIFYQSPRQLNESQLFK